MNDTAKVALAIGAGVLTSKIVSSTAAWWVLGGSMAIFLVNSPTTQSTISRGAKTAYSGAKTAYSAYKSR
jgi:hypothetical protein